MKRLILVFIGIAIAIISFIVAKKKDTEIIDPGYPVAPVAIPTPVASGYTSWYGTGENECLGCNEERIMANGERLDDEKYTAACRINDSCRLFDVGKVVEIENTSNGKRLKVIITDRGGLRPGRILDVTKAVKRFLNLKGDDLVSVYLVE